MARFMSLQLLRIAFALLLAGILAEVGQSQEKSSARAKLPVPEMSSQSAADREMEKIFDFSSVKSPGAAIKLSDELRKAAMKASNRPAQRYVLRMRASELACKGGDARRMLSAIDEIAAEFDVDGVELKCRAIRDLLQSPLKEEELESLVSEASSVFEQAEVEERLDLAVETADALYQATVRRPTMVDCRKAAYDLRNRLHATHGEWTKFRAALAALKTRPEDAAANAVAGRWRCLRQADWHSGLPLLAKGDDGGLASAASADLKAGTNAAVRIAVADFWYAQAKLSDENAGFLARAQEHYAAALAAADGLARMKIDKRLQEIDAVPEAQRLIELAKRRASSERSAAGSSHMKLQRIMEDFSTGVLGVSFSPDGRLLATTGMGKDIRILDAKSFQTVRTLRGHSECRMARCVEFSPDGRLLASGAEDNLVILWDTERWQSEHTLRGHDSPIFDLAFSPDGRTLASASDDRTIRLWDVKTASHRLTLSGHSSWIWSVAFSPDGRQLASGGGADRTLRLWDVASGKETAVCRGHEGKVRQVAYLPEGKTVASVSDDGTLRYWDAASGRLQKTSPLGTLYSLAVFRDEKRAMVAGAGKAIQCIDLATMQRQFVVHESVGQAIWALQFSPDGRTFISAGGGNSLSVWDVAKP